jgi:ssDNA-binding replication factor A large subunit
MGSKDVNILTPIDISGDSVTPKIADRANKVLKELEEKTKLTHDELLQRVKEKQAEFGDMLTIEGASHLVAKDLGIKLLDGDVKKLEMRNIVPGMRSVNAVGKIFKISGVVEFTRNNSPGKVVNLFIGDGTSYVRLPLWNDQVKLVEDEELKVGDVVKIMNAMAREGMFGIELSLGKYGRIAPMDEEVDIELPDAEQMAKRYLSPDAGRERVSIKDVLPGNFESRAFIVQVFRSNFIFNTCPECGSKLSMVDGKYMCDMHGEVEPEPALVLSAIADDGTDSIRVTFFRSVAEQICGVKAQEIAKMDMGNRYVAIAESILGREFVLDGRVQKNQQFDRTEMIVNSIGQLNISEEAEKIINTVEMSIGQAEQI